MPTATKAETTNTESKAAPETALTGSAKTAAAIADTNRTLEKLNQQAEALGNDIATAEAELKAKQQQLTAERQREQAEAKEQALSEQLRALKAKAVKLNEAAAAFAELYESFKGDYRRYLNSLSPEESRPYSTVSGRSFNASSLPYVTGTETGSEVVRITTLANAPKDGSNGGEP